MYRQFSEGEGVTHALQGVHKCRRTRKTYFTKSLAPGTNVELDVKSAQHVRDTRDVVTYLYGVMQDMQDLYDSGARVNKGALHPK